MDIAGEMLADGFQVYVASIASWNDGLGGLIDEVGLTKCPTEPADAFGICLQFSAHPRNCLKSGNYGFGAAIATQGDEIDYDWRSGSIHHRYLRGGCRTVAFACGPH